MPKKFWRLHWKKREDDKAEAQREREEAADNSYRDHIVSSLQAFYEHLKTEAHKRDTRKKRERRIERYSFRRERKKFGFEVAGVIGAWAAAAIFAVQSYIFYRTMWDARDADRPYIWVLDNSNSSVSWESINDPKQPDMGRIKWIWSMKNYGRGLAVHEADDSAVFFGKLPDGVMAVRADDPGIPVPPTNTFFQTSYSVQHLSKAAFDSLASRDDSMWMRSTVTYHDKFRHDLPYVTYICLGYRRAGGNDYCSHTEVN